jgi:hypothetical protein
MRAITETIRKSNETPIAWKELKWQWYGMEIGPVGVTG